MNPVILPPSMVRQVGLFNLGMAISIGERKLNSKPDLESDGSTRIFLPKTRYISSIPQSNQVMG